MNVYTPRNGYHELVKLVAVTALNIGYFKGYSMRNFGDQVLMSRHANELVASNLQNFLNCTAHNSVYIRTCVRGASVSKT
jgi:hypothetical protein